MEGEMEELCLQSFDGFPLKAAWFPVENARFCVQLIHGALEHKERYYPFISFLNAHGCSAIIADNRGHGASVTEKYPPGFMNGVKESMRDQELLADFLKVRQPDVKRILFGHSFGSCLARCYLQEHDMDFVGLILSGTANYIAAVPLGLVIGRLCMLFTGKKGYSRVIQMLAGGDKPPETWISYNKENLRSIAEDPLFVPRFQNAGQMTVFQSDWELKRYRRFRCQNPDLKILSITGKDDPVTGGEAGLLDTIATLRKIGYSDVESIVYPDMMHEVLNETRRERVYTDILHFLDKCM